MSRNTVRSYFLLESLPPKSHPKSTNIEIFTNHIVARLNITGYKIKDIIGLSYVDFLAELAKTQGYISSTAATKSYRIGRNKDKTIMQQYVEIHGKDREEFGAMRYNEMTDL